MDAKQDTKKSDIDEQGFEINTYIPEECLDPDGADCPHMPKPNKKEKNPV